MHILIYTRINTHMYVCVHEVKMNLAFNVTG